MPLCSLRNSIRLLRHALASTDSRLTQRMLTFLLLPPPRPSNLFTTTARNTIRAFAGDAYVTGNEATGEEHNGMPIVNAETAPTLEWVLSNPPPLHCFDEPPILVEFEEFEHLAAGGH